jgi:hypothetical protein
MALRNCGFKTTSEPFEDGFEGIPEIFQKGTLTFRLGIRFKI